MGGRIAGVGSLMLSGAEEGAVRLWAATAVGALRWALDGHTAAVVGVAFAGADVGVSCCEEGQLVVWALGAARELRRLRLGGVPSGLASLPSGKTAVAIGLGRIVALN